MSNPPEDEGASRDDAVLAGLFARAEEELIPAHPDYAPDEGLQRFLDKLGERQPAASPRPSRLQDPQRSRPAPASSDSESRTAVAGVLVNQMKAASRTAGEDDPVIATIVRSSDAKPVSGELVVDAGSPRQVWRSGTVLAITLEARSARVVIHRMRPVVLSRRPPGSACSGPTGSYVAGVLPPRTFTLDLDSDPAVLRAEDADFPFTVSSTDVEQFRVSISTTDAEVSFHFEIDWTCAGRSGTTVIDNDGKPFEVSPGEMPVSNVATVIARLLAMPPRDAAEVISRCTIPVAASLVTEMAAIEVETARRIMEIVVASRAGQIVDHMPLMEAVTVLSLMLPGEAMRVLGKSDVRTVADMIAAMPAETGVSLVAAMPEHRAVDVLGHMRTSAAARVLAAMPGRLRERLLPRLPSALGDLVERARNLSGGEGLSTPKDRPAPADR